MKHDEWYLDKANRRSPPSRGARIETPRARLLPSTIPSPPSRGARIETGYLCELGADATVAPFTGGAD